ncbi:replication initiator protein RctB domain-containing protein [Ferrimonas marina]|uniref:replication initiator protein RctB domain-containing protein n=1 Tax=Ferrimonas marina TaxID=299255 RepID=UPI0013563B83|nr:replication initiator protein RctB domain-containing protein [Ferrimonas marina]
MTQADGNLILVDDIESMRAVLEQCSAPKNPILSQSHQDIIKVVCWSLRPTEGRQFITVKQIQQAIGLERDVVNQRISRIRSKGVLKKVEFTLPEGTPALPKTQCMRMATLIELASIAQASEKRNQRAASAKNRSGTGRAAKKAFLATQGLPAEMAVDVPESPRGLIPKNTPPFEQIVPPKGSAKKKHVANVSRGHDKFMVSCATTDDHVMELEDLQVLYLLIAMTINQWSNCIEFLKQKQIKPFNRAYIEVNQMCKILNKSGSFWYKNLAKSVLRIKSTVFDLHQLEAMYIDDEGNDIYSSKEFRFFQNCTSYSKDRARVVETDEGEEVEVLPKSFMIEWNEELYKNMLTDKHLFVLPISVLSAHPDIFWLYVHLRNRFSKKSERVVIDIQELHDRMSPGQTATNFKRTLATALEQWRKRPGVTTSTSEACEMDIAGQMQELTVTAIDLEGFQVELYTDGKPDRIVRLEATCNHHKMLKSLHIDSGTDGMAPGKDIKAAPQVPNPLTALEPVMRFARERGEEWPKEFLIRIAQKKLQDSVSFRQSKYLLTCTINDTQNQYVLTRYSRFEDLMLVAGALELDIADEASLFSMLDKKRAQLSLIQCEGEKGVKGLSLDSFSDLQERLYRQHATVVETTELVEFLIQRSTLRRSVIDAWSSRSEDARVKMTMAVVKALGGASFVQERSAEQQALF